MPITTNAGAGCRLGAGSRLGARLAADFGAAGAASGVSSLSYAYVCLVDMASMD